MVSRELARISYLYCTYQGLSAKGDLLTTLNQHILLTRVLTSTGTSLFRKFGLISHLTFLFPFMIVILIASHEAQHEGWNRDAGTSWRCRYVFSEARARLAKAIYYHGAELHNIVVAAGKKPPTTGIHKIYGKKIGAYGTLLHPTIHLES